MQTETILKQIANDVADIKRKVEKIEESIGELDMEMREVKPEYMEKLKKIEKGNHYKFRSMDELRALVENV